MTTCHDGRPYLTRKLVLLGTADLRVIRLLLNHCIASYLLPQAIEHLSHLQGGTGDSVDFQNTIICLFDLIRPSIRSDLDESTSRHEPPTVVSQTIINAHLPPIILSAILLAYTPTAPPQKYARLRSKLQEVVRWISPTQALSTLGAVLRMCQHGQKAQPRGWSRKWPSYVIDSVTSFMTYQMERPGGIRAVMENTFGEAGNLGESRSFREEGF